MDVGGDDVAQLAQPFPVVGGFQLLFLNGQLSGQAGAEVLDGLADGLALLAHGILPIPDGVVHIQKRAKALCLLAVTVLADGAEGKLLGGSVREGVVIGCRMTEMFMEE